MTSPAAWRSRIVAHGTADPAALVDNPSNWRLHGAAQSAAMAGVLSEVGYVQSVIVNRTSGRLVDGHLRAQLARERGEAEIPVVYVELSDDEERLVLATLDPIGALAETDTAALSSLLDSVAPTADGLAALLAGLRPEAPIVPREDPGPQFDRAEELRVKWGTERGQVWEIGRHRLLCGDSTSAGDVGRLMGGKRAECVLADPPFGINYRGHGESREGRANRFAPIAGDDTPSAVWLGHCLPTDGGALYVKTTWKVLRFWEDALGALATIKSRIVWDKRSPVAGDVERGYATCSEIILFATIGHHKLSAFDTDVWNIPRATIGAPENRTGHPYESPVELQARAIRNSAADGGLVLDPFVGSGTTIVAAEQVGRICYAMEIHPPYVAVALERLAGMGLAPRLVD